MQHTKTPWRVGNPSQMGSVVADEPVPEVRGSDAVSHYGGHLIAESIAPRNAEFIVRACNSYDQLVALLKAADNKLEAMHHYHSGSPALAIEGLRKQIAEGLAAAGAA